MTPDTLNKWRIIPRLMIMLYAGMCWHVSVWFMAIPDPTATQSAFTVTIWGAAAAWFGLYVNSGNQ